MKKKTVIFSLLTITIILSLILHFSRKGETTRLKKYISSESSPPIKDILSVEKHMTEIKNKIKEETHLNSDPHNWGKEEINSFYKVLDEANSQIEKLDHEIMTKFDKIEKHIKDSNLPEIAMQRHKKFTALYEKGKVGLENIYEKAYSVKDDLIIDKSSSVIKSELYNRDQQARAEIQNSIKELKGFFSEDELSFEQNIVRARKKSDEPLPWRHVAAKEREPRLKSDYEPVYKRARLNDADYNPHPADFTQTIDTEMISELSELAKDLEYDPIKIYEWVLNNIYFQPYYGSAKGAAKTYYDRASNDFDTASLLIALLRESEIPCRYVYGTIRLSAVQANNLFGTESAAIAATILARGGIPALWDGFELLIEHCWVEAYVPYDNYRGTKSKEGGDTWIPLDPSFKTYSYTDGLQVAKEIRFDWKNFFENGVTEKTAVEMYKDQIAEYIESNYPDKTIEDVPITRTIKSENLGILPLSLPYEIESIHSDYSEIPDVLRHKIRCKVFSDPHAAFFDETTFDITLPTVKVYNKRTTIGWIGATEGDQKILDNFGGIYLTPSYLVKIKPAYLLDGKIMTKGDAVNIGTTQYVRNYVIMPDGVELQGSGNEYEYVFQIIKTPFAAGEIIGIGHGFQGFSEEYINKQIEILNSNKDSKNYDDIFGLIAYLNSCYWFHNIHYSDLVACGLRHVWYCPNQLSFGISILKGNEAHGFMGVGKNNILPNSFVTDVPCLIWTMFPLHLEDVDDELSRIMGCSESQYEGITYKDLYGMPPVSAVSIIQYAYETNVPVINGWTDDDPMTDDIYVQDTVKYHDWIGSAHISNNHDDGGYIISGSLNGGCSATALGASFDNPTVFFKINDIDAEIIADVYCLIPIGGFMPSIIEQPEVDYGLTVSAILYKKINSEWIKYEEILGEYPYNDDITKTRFDIGSLSLDSGEYKLEAEYDFSWGLVDEVMEGEYSPEVLIYIAEQAVSGRYIIDCSGTQYAPDDEGNVYAPFELGGTRNMVSGFTLSSVLSEKGDVGKTLASIIEPGMYTVYYEDGGILRYTELFLIKVDLQNVEGQSENGSLRVRGKVTPEVAVSSSKIVINDEVIMTGGSFMAGSFGFTIDQDRFSSGENTVDLELDINDLTFIESFVANREDIIVTGSDNYFQAYSFGDSSGGGILPFTFPMELTEKYSYVTYSLPQSGRTAYIEKSELLLSNILDPGPLGKKAILYGAGHRYIKKDGTDYLEASFDLPDPPVIIPENSIYREIATRKWVIVDDYATIDYGIADINMAIDTGAGLSWPIPWPSPLIDNDVEAPDQTGF